MSLCVSRPWLHMCAWICLACVRFLCFLHLCERAVRSSREGIGLGPGKERMDSSRVIMTTTAYIQIMGSTETTR